MYILPKEKEAQRQTDLVTNVETVMKEKKDWEGDGRPDQAAQEMKVSCVIGVYEVKMFDAEGELCDWRL